MRTFGVYIKNPFYGADYEDEIEAKDREDAVNVFYGMLAPFGWPKDRVEKLVVETTSPNECVACGKPINFESEAFDMQDGKVFHTQVCTVKELEDAN